MVLFNMIFRTVFIFFVLITASKVEADGDVSKDKSIQSRALEVAELLNRNLKSGDFLVDSRSSKERSFDSPRIIVPPFGPPALYNPFNYNALTPITSPFMPLSTYPTYAPQPVSPFPVAAPGVVYTQPQQVIITSAQPVVSQVTTTAPDGVSQPASTPSAQPTATTVAVTPQVVAAPVSMAAPVQQVLQVAPVQPVATYQPAQLQPYYSPYNYGLPGYGFPGYGCPSFMPGCIPPRYSLGNYVADGINYSRVFDGFTYLDPALAFQQRWPYVGF